MPIFARRLLQQMLLATDALIPEVQRKRRCNLLNSATDQSLDTEWEVALFHALAQLGKISHEPDFGGTTFPDVYFQLPALEFVADIAAVNDSSYERENPLREFGKQFYRRVLRAGLPTNLFRYHVASERIGPKTRLMLPRGGNWDALFDQNFRNLLRAATLLPSEPLGLRRQEQDFDVTFWYTPGQQHGTGGHSGDYLVSTSLTNNPIYNTLKRKKDQLKSCGFQGVMGVILCDGGCRQLQHSERIVQRFLRSTTSIAFVSVYRVEGHRAWRSDGISVTGRCYLNTGLDGTSVGNSLRGLFEVKVPAALPEATDDVTNALNHLRWKN
ncbi:MAG: hypothetical protein QOC81_4128, partial [Thermoanaerobaculia bacterium]|nr:hypothetical protein [Thermoanaerobaculia bacterium]